MREDAASSPVHRGGSSRFRPHTNGGWSLAGRLMVIMLTGNHFTIMSMYRLLV